MAASADEVQWAPVYVIGAGYKKVNGAWIGAGNYGGCLRYKQPKHPIWAFFCEEKTCWVFANKARYLQEAKLLYKNLSNCEGGSPIPFKGWKKGSPPGSAPPPKVISTAFVQGDEIECFSKKSKAWKQGKVTKVNESGTYKCQLQGMRKAINVPRQQIRMINEMGGAYTENQFVEINTKSGDWLPAMIGGVKDSGKYYIVLPDGKGANYSEEKIRPTELCRDVAEAAPKAAAEPAAVPTDDGEKDVLIGQLQQRITKLQADLAESRKSNSTAAPAPFSTSQPSSALNPELVSQIREKQSQLLSLSQEIQELQERLFSE